jgi:5-formyltetrahydrofolate cyclo-ligase
MYELKIQKNKIRTQYIDKRKALPPDLKKNYDEKICSLFMALVTYRYSDVLLMYYPTNREIDVLPVARHALDNGKRVAFPCCDAHNHTMVFRLVTSLDELTVPGTFGIPEPSDNCPVFVQDKSSGRAVCLVPAIVYDKKGYRLGYGKGFYDRYLPSFSGTKVGFVYSDFVIGSVPRGRYDLCVDILVTEKGVRALHAG